MPGSFTKFREALKRKKLFELKVCPGVCPGAFSKASTIHFSHYTKQIVIQLCNGTELDQVVGTHRTYCHIRCDNVTSRGGFVSSGFSENKGLWRLLSLAGSQNLPQVDLILYLPNSQPSLLNIYFRISGFQSSLLLISM